MAYNIEWLNINSNRKYPFIQESDLKEVNNRFTVPNDFLVDAMLMVSKDFQSLFYVSRIEYSPEILTVDISLIDTTPVMSGSVQNPGSTDKNFQLILSGKDSYVGSFGRLTIGSLENMAYGVFLFNPDHSIIEPCRVLKLNSGVSSINGITSGNILLSTGSNVSITVQGNQILLDTLDGLCACNDIPCVRTINSIRPRNNNFNITGLGCVSVVAAENGVKVVNNCEDSCCGCDEINDFVDRMQALENRILALENQLVVP